MAEFLRWALAEETPLELIGHGTKRLLGSPVQAAHTLSLRACRASRSTSPTSWCLRAWPARRSPKSRQRWQRRTRCSPSSRRTGARCYGARRGSGTIGGVIACNLAGPRRLKAGAARDHFLGFRAVSGRGESLQGRRPGGEERHRLRSAEADGGLDGHAGRHDRDHAEGAAARRRSCAPCCSSGSKTTRAIAALARAQQLPFEVSGAAHLPAEVAALSAIDLVRAPGTSVTAIRIEGAPASVADRCARAAQLLCAGMRGGGRRAARHALGRLLARRSRRRTAAARFRCDDRAAPAAAGERWARADGDGGSREGRANGSGRADLFSRLGRRRSLGLEPRSARARGCRARRRGNVWRHRAADPQCAGGTAGAG